MYLKYDYSVLIKQLQITNQSNFEYYKVEMQNRSGLQFLTPLHLNCTVLRD